MRSATEAAPRILPKRPGILRRLAIVAAAIVAVALAWALIGIWVWLCVWALNPA